MPRYKSDKTIAVGARALRARQRLLRRLANFDVDALRNVPKETVVVLTWQDIVDLIALRHQLRTPKKGTMAHYLIYYGGRVGRVLDRYIANIKKREWRKMIAALRSRRICSIAS